MRRTVAKAIAAASGLFVILLAIAFAVLNNS